MPTEDKCCSIVPYFKVPSENMIPFKALCQEAVEKAKNKEGCLYYGFSFDGDRAHCREGFENAEATLAYFISGGKILREMLLISELERLEIHGPETELAKLREPLAPLDPQFFTLEFGFRR
uniref:Uncharacterized protein n=1 Tax=Candidatus Kentrum sp. TUN TaxID=2126343 RepID=A0A450ZJH1_9GAMM|nr:MAG: hypothetical protein BECKTUN1418F_GA0071002_10333 [Candidatus Kentron sp. TUN]VFK55845.1 MAG: hypothetical protein BECKTUN1418E_GA0071001_10343 [Candidatus Kentron sp. TUN]VFK58282.1 MAG: hypothetical protein BECKTUN1418D_GA0071000_10794 [Candidatus Kentron sp. TUN]